MPEYEIQHLCPYLKADMLIFVKTLERVLIVSVVIVIAVELAACGVATPAPTATTTTIPTPTPTAQYLDTPTLIAQAFGRGEITEEERLLYLAYALYEYESLPVQFRSNVGWFGESYVIELQEAFTTPEMFCSMSPHVRNEILRLFDSDMLCN